MDRYVDYDFYTTVFKGSIIPELQFDKVALEATFYVNQNTFNRIQKVNDIVKEATCAIAELFYKEKKQNDEQIASESVGPHSVSYVKNTKSQEEFDKERFKMLRMYLSTTNLMNRRMP